MSYAEVMHSLPLMSPAAVFGERGLLFVAPHPDDETLGCGGLLGWASRHARLRHVVFLTNGEQSHPGSALDVASIRCAEAQAAAMPLGLAPEQMSFLGLPDGGLPGLSNAVRRGAASRLRQLAMSLRPCVVLVTAETDMHGDHRAAFALVRDAILGLAQVELMTYPVWSWLLPDNPPSISGMRIDIRAFREHKAAALRAYVSQREKSALDVDGFTLPEELLRHVHSDTEVFLYARV